MPHLGDEPWPRPGPDPHPARISGTATRGHGAPSHRGGNEGVGACRCCGVYTASPSGGALVVCRWRCARCCLPKTTPTGRAIRHAERVPYVKDGIHEAVVHGRMDRVNPGQKGSKVAAHFQATVDQARRLGAGALCRSRAGPGVPSGQTFRVGDHLPILMRSSASAATRLTNSMRPFRTRGSSEDERRVQRQAWAGALEQAVLPFQRRAVAQRRSRPTGPTGSAPCKFVMPTGGTCTTFPCSRCPTSGNIPGLPPGTWRSTRPVLP